MADMQKWHGDAVYKIKVRGKLSKEWETWFDNLEVISMGSESVIIGRVADQSALHGVLSSIRDLGLPLLSLERVEE